MTHRAGKYGDNDAAMAILDDLGHIFGRVLDSTFGAGVFWKKVKVLDLWVMDAAGPRVRSDRASGSIRIQGDFTAPPFEARSFDTVVYDPPYKLNGTPDPDPLGPDYRFGVHNYERWQDRMDLIMAGVRGLAPLVAPQGRLIVKCMDQVCSGAVRWQTDEVTAVAHGRGLIKMDRLDLMNDPREQPEDRDTVHLEANYSSFLVFRAPGRRTKEERERQAA